MFKKIWILLFVLILISFTLIGCQSYSTTNIEKYGEFNMNKYVINLSLDVFPAEVDDDACNQYVFIYKAGVLDDRCQIFLDCSYNEDDYEAEVSRIQKISGGEFMQRVNSKYITENQIVYNEEWFKYPAYVVTYVEGKKYEYVMLFENERRIIYVGLQYCPLSTIEFDHDYLPINYANFTHW